MLLAWLLLATATYAGDGAPVTGVVQDSSGAVIFAASVTLLTSQQAVLGTTATDLQGRFFFSRIPPGKYVLVASAPGFAEARTLIEVGQGAVESLRIPLSIEPRRDLITVTASYGSVESLETTAQPVNLIEKETIRERAGTVLAQLANEETGIHLQRTSPTIAAIYVRGLTGNKVNVFFDGVRYSTSAMRGGINTFFDLVEPSSLQAVEILRGPSSAQYGSDALGGSVQLLSRAPSFSPTGKPSLHGSLDTHWNTADMGAGSSVASIYAGRNFAVLVNMAARRVSRLRPGGGFDSHSAPTRFFGLRSDALIGGRLPDTAFTQYGGMIKLNWALSSRSQLLAQYSRNQQDGGKRYDQLLGGDGNLVADLRNLMLDLAYVRYDRFRLGWLDYFTAVYSFNSQREERVNQGGSGNPRASISHEFERTNAHGFQLHARKQLGARHSLLAGTEYYHERIHSPSFGVDPVTRVATLRRPRVPDNAQYRSGGIYLQDSLEALPNRLRLVGNIRCSGASYRARAEDSPIVSGRRLWPDDSLSVSDVTFRGGFILTVSSGLNLFGNVSRGFRAPHMTDLGTFGLTGSGFEVAAPDTAGMGAMIGSSAGTTAVSTGRKVEQLEPETSLNYEAGARFRNKRLGAEVTFFVNDLKNSVTKQALILPPGAVGLSLAGQTITAQEANGVVFVAAATNPVLVRANWGDARVHGVEQTLDWLIKPNLALSTVFTYLDALDLQTRLPPNIEGGTPAPDGYLKIRYTEANHRFWLEPYVHAAARQKRLSSLALEDRRTGATRSRSSIRTFFLNGATFHGWVGPGPDGVLGTADDRLLATGETLAHIQDRVLGPGMQAAPLFSAIPGYITFNLRAGIRLAERQDVLLDFANIGDRNYRGVSWGIDAPGRSISVRYRIRF